MDLNAVAYALVVHELGERDQQRRPIVFLLRLARAHAEDTARLERAAAVFDDLHAHFQR